MKSVDPNQSSISSVTQAQGEPASTDAKTGGGIIGAQNGNPTIGADSKPLGSDLPADSNPLVSDSTQRFIAKAGGQVLQPVSNSLLSDGSGLAVDAAIEGVNSAAGAVAKDATFDAAHVIASDTVATALTKGPISALSGMGANLGVETLGNLGAGAASNLAEVATNGAVRTVLSNTTSAVAKSFLNGDFAGVSSEIASSVIGDSVFGASISGVGGTALRMVAGAGTGGVLLAVTEVSTANGPEAKLEEYSSQLAKNDITNTEGRPLTILEAQQLAGLRNYHAAP